MTVGELIQLLSEHEPEREVLVTLEVEHDLFDSPIDSVSMRAGVICINGAEE